MRMIIFLSMLMILGLSGLAQAKDGCKCGNVIGILEMNPPQEVSFAGSYGSYTIQVYQGGGNPTYWYCLCFPDDSECLSWQITTPPSPIHWTERYPGYWDQGLNAPCRWYTTTEEYQCGDAGC